MEHVDGVVGRLMQAVQDAHGASSLMAAATMVLVKRASSTAWLQENVNTSSLISSRSGTKVDALVPLDSGVSCGGPLGESGWVEHHDVVLRQVLVFRYSKASAWMLLCLEASMPLRRTFSSHTSRARAELSKLCTSSAPADNAEMLNPPV